MHNGVGKIFEEAAEHRARVLESRVDGGLSRHQVRKDVSIHEREEVFEVDGEDMRKTKGLLFMPPEPLTCIECTLLVQASLSWKHICTLIRTDTIQLYTCHGYAY